MQNQSMHEESIPSLPREKFNASISHFSYKDCKNFLLSKNPHTTLNVEELEALTDLDAYLLRLTQTLYDVSQTIVFLRTFGVLDRSDQDVITNKAVNRTSSEEITSLVDRLSSKGPHAYWYLAHALQARHPDLYQQMHGELQCCVCEEVHAEVAKLGNQNSLREKQENICTGPVFVLKLNELFDDPNRESFLKEEQEQCCTKLGMVLDKFNVIVDKLRLLSGKIDFFSKRFSDEINDVLPQELPTEEVLGHTNLKVIDKLKIKYASFKRNGSFSPTVTRQPLTCGTSEDNAPSLTGGDTRSLMKPFTNKHAKDEASKTEKMDLNCDEVLIRMEDKCCEVLSSYRPMTAVKEQCERLMDVLRVNRWKCFVICGLSLFVTACGPYLLVYGSTLNKRNSISAD